MFSFNLFLLKLVGMLQLELQSSEGAQPHLVTCALNTPLLRTTLEICKEMVLLQLIILLTFLSEYIAKAVLVCAQKMNELSYMCEAVPA